MEITPKIGIIIYITLVVHGILLNVLFGKTEKLEKQILKLSKT